MFWRSDIDRVYVLYVQAPANPLAGTWELRQERWDGSNPDGVGLNPPPGRLEPKRGFGWLWRTHLGGFQGPLGWALEAETGFCVVLQPFDFGLAFSSSTVPFCHDQFGNPARDPAFAPLLFSLIESGTWTRH
jgi:hypothetical protein